MSDSRYPANIGDEIAALRRRVSELERANRLARGSWHDGTRTRGHVGKFTDPDSASEEQGLYIIDSSGNEIFRVNDTGVFFKNLPTSDPSSSGQLWRSSGDARISV